MPPGSGGLEVVVERVEDERSVGPPGEHSVGDHLLAIGQPDSFAAALIYAIPQALDERPRLLDRRGCTAQVSLDRSANSLASSRSIGTNSMMTASNPRTVG